MENLKFIEAVTEDGDDIVFNVDNISTLRKVKPETLWDEEETQEDVKDLCEVSLIKAVQSHRVFIVIESYQSLRERINKLGYLF